MKKLIILFIILFLAGPLYAEQTINFEWDVTEDVTVTGYNLYSGESVTGPWVKENQGLITEVTYSKIFPDGIESGYWFYVTASDGRNESGPSNIVDCMIDTKAPAAIQTLTITSD